MSLPFRNQSLRIYPAHKLFPRTASVLGRPGAERRQVQSLGHLLEPGGELAVVDVSVFVRVELVEQSFDLSFGDVELPADHGEVLVLDPARFVHITSGKQSAKAGSLHR